MIDLQKIQRVAVGSKNPIKIAAVENVLSYYVDHEIEIVGMSVASGVSDMPLSEQETSLGAYNRAKRCMGKGDYDLAIGLEGGVDFSDDILGHEVCYLFGCGCVLDKKGKHIIGRGDKFILPVSIAQRLKAGEELGLVMDEIMQMENTKHKQGAVGFFSKDYISRQDSFEHIVCTALVPWLRPELYDG